MLTGFFRVQGKKQSLKIEKIVKVDCRSGPNSNPDPKRTNRLKSTEEESTVATRLCLSLIGEKNGV
ncbi:hypothetical protein LguiA_034065 [Lonicera macranthoides]